MKTPARSRLSVVYCLVLMVTILAVVRILSIGVGTRNLSVEFEASYKHAFEESFRFFDDIEDSQWLLQQNRARNEPIFQDPRNPDSGIENIGLWMMENVDPIFTCPHERRVGGRGDGPKWVCDPHRLAKKSDCLIYSVGSEGNYLFEDGLYQMMGKHCEIHVFDPNPSYARPGDPENKNIHFHPWGMKSSSDGLMTVAGNLDFRSFPEILDALGHVGRRIDVFKIDCEGCEWKSYTDWIADSVDIRQILIETHPPAAFALNVSIGGFVSDLAQRGFLPFHKEANTNPQAQPLGSLFEWGFVRLHPSFLRYTTSTH
jgi:Methyltransferase domain